MGVPATLRATVGQWLTAGRSPEEISARLARTGAHVTPEDVRAITTPPALPIAPHMSSDPGETLPEKARVLCTIAHVAYDRHHPNIRYLYRTRPDFNPLTGEITGWDLILDEHGDPIPLTEGEALAVQREAKRQQAELDIAIRALRGAGQLAAVPTLEPADDGEPVNYVVALPPRVTPDE